MATKGTHGYTNSKELNNLNVDKDKTGKVSNIHGSDFNKDLNVNVNEKEPLSTGYDHTSDINKNINKGDLKDKGSEHIKDLDINVDSDDPKAKGYSPKVNLNLYTKTKNENIGKDLGTR